ncbi:uncharacterized protein LOC123322234 [Coccinella septempunctata]|uniref:uncharacterized protein LOC123322234 n=1 Tax=Coccinella septempunctata TaxID=41139 RepID=UPI001D07A3DA|nr:uncharacterized protein LOC123322234 [Coccinella septempunctata]
MPSVDHNIMLTSLSVGSDDSRSTSPVTPTFFKEARGMKLFRAISRKLGKLSNENISFFDEDSRSSSTDTCSLTSNERRCSRRQGRTSSPNHLSSSSSETGSDFPNRHRHHHSSSAESIRQVIQNLELNTRSQSCTNSKDCKRKAVKKTTPKKILRSPVAYTYVKGLSGLPTQRVPKSCMSNYNTCGCNTFYMGLNR